MGRPHAAVRRARHARSHRRQGGRLRRDHRQANACSPPLACARPAPGCSTRRATGIWRRVLIKRGEAALVRRCHGDLHLRNIVLIDGEPTLFDAVEFSDAIATGDVLYDLAFVLMALEERGLRQAVNRLMSRYLQASGEVAHLSGLAAL